MRVLVAHNRYRSGQPSGENAIVDAEVAGLRGRGVTVDLLLAESDDIADFGLVARAGLPLRPTWSAATRRRFRAMVDAHRPDVVHVHNLYPLLSPMVVRWAGSAGLPVVATVHNVRLACLAGTWFRDGGECRDCAGHRVPLPGVRHGCHPQGRAAGTALAVAHGIHRGTWRQVDRYLAVSRYVTEALTAAAIPPDRIEVRPNGVADPGPSGPPGRHVLFAGRLSEAKGLPLLLEAWRRGPRPPGAELRLAGDGDLRAAAERAAADDPSIRVLGQLGPEAIQAELRAAAVVAVPSLGPEACPTVVLEALAAGRAVVATPVGGLPELVDDAVGTLAPARPEALAGALSDVAGDAVDRGAAARRRYEERFTADRALDRLVAVYDELAG